MAGIGEEGKAAGEDAADDLGDHVAGNQDKGEEQAAAAEASEVVSVVVVAVVVMAFMPVLVVIVLVVIVVIVLIVIMSVVVVLGMSLMIMMVVLVVVVSVVVVGLQLPNLTQKTCPLTSQTTRSRDPQNDTNSTSAFGDGRGRPLRGRLPIRTRW